ncbi:hypothetical protein ACROYT_G023043 [Oculina patagonica]
MSSIVTSVFKATIGLLVNKGRDKAAEKLKDGDVTDQRFRGLIVREIDDIKSKLDGLSRKDLLASISFFEEGIELLYEVFDKGESAARLLTNAKERFKDSRKEATRAFENEALETSDRILAMKYRVMATILETVDNPTDALAPCRLCIKELNCLPAVQNSFDVQLKKGLKGLFSKEQRRKIIFSVCHVNRVMYDVMQALGKDVHLLIWPAVVTHADKVDPLRDGRLTEVLREQGMDHCCVVPWSFGQGREEKYKLMQPRGIATNSSGHFIVADYGDRNIKAFDSSGNLINQFSPPNDCKSTKFYVHDVATDVNDNMYALVEERKIKKEERKMKIGSCGYEGNPKRQQQQQQIQQLQQTQQQQQQQQQIFLQQLQQTQQQHEQQQQHQRPINSVIDRYEADGQFVRSFGEGLLCKAKDITAANDGRVMVTDAYNGHVTIFSDYGDLLSVIKLREECVYPQIAFHRKTEHIVVVGKEQEKDRLCVMVYTKDGDFVRSIHIHEEEFGYFITGTAVTMEGRIGVALQHLSEAGKVLVM